MYWAEAASLIAWSSMTISPVIDADWPPPSSDASVSGTEMMSTSTPRITSMSGNATTIIPAHETQNDASGIVPTTTPTPSANWPWSGLYLFSGGVAHQSSSLSTGSGFEMCVKSRVPFMVNRPLNP